jgi:hypothetical protein
MTEKERLRLLLKKLNKIKKIPLINFDSAKSIKSNGVYFVYRDKKIIYIGSTTTEGHKRIGDLKAWDMHTLHNKLLKESLRIDHLVWCKKGKTSKYSKEQLIKDGKFTNEQFNQEDKKVTDSISRFKFRFVNMSSKDSKEIKNFEHFLIAIYNPPYND